MSKGKKRIVILTLFSLIALILITYQHNRIPSVFFRVISYPYDVFNRFTMNIIMTSRELYDAFDENKRLKKELNAALMEKQRFAEIVQENRRLKELLSLKDHLPNYVATAKVVARGYDRLLNTLILDKGKNNGIKKDMSVITPRGLVGKIYSVRDDFSEVLLLSDPNFSAAVRLQKSRYEGVISGTGHRYCILKYIPPEEWVEKDEVVVTSGLDGIFPPGLLVGVVSSIRKEGIEFFQDIKVMPFQADTKIEEVIILSN
ncbi:rod shape-determining protein MreC [Dissulfurispira thermophila]|uniref:Cell shape-determining protein MreC n=2 Tax=root TaxID=1 RepID=A0A7G1H402_9BACT|nr:rod shape-determining protein MreC [Dissulfurispira thermophila]BCB97448.1 rod shape-determining protein MreC [Dissulfurispira thermophila]